MELLRVTFNTGRLYSEFGQAITAVLHEDAKVLFHDHTRYITGEMECSMVLNGSVEDQKRRLAWAVMSRYDRHNYRPNGVTLKQDAEVVQYRC